MRNRTHTAAPKFGDGDVGGLVAGKTLLDAIEIRFRLAGAGPSPLSVDGRRFGHGLPRRRIPLPERPCGGATAGLGWMADHRHRPRSSPHA
jgi:hypothetical protein